MVSRIIVHSGSVDFLLNKQALRQTLVSDSGSLPAPTPNGKSRLVTLTCEVRLEHCRGGVRFTVGPHSTEKLQVRPAQSLIKAIVRAQRWYDQIVQGVRPSCRAIAQAEGFDERYVSRILQFAFLTPDIVKSILDGRQSTALSLENFRTHLPIDWDAQRQKLGVPAT